MAKKQFNQASERLLRSATQLNQKLTSQERFWLMRSGFVGRPAQPESGFILPTVTRLLLMLSLVLGILIFRTGNRTNQVIGERQQRQIYNATTPAIERAKAKIEFLFSEDTLPALPSETDIEVSLKNDGAQTGPNGAFGRYTLRDETRVDINGDDILDNAWTFQFDSDGDGNAETQVGYSILSLASVDPDNDADTDNDVALQDPDATKAQSLVVRNGPINLSGGVGNPNCPNPGLSPFQGWQNVTGASLRKSIQVHAFARNPNTGVVSTLEMQQDKQANLGNKWGAWFRNDMEIFPGPAFNWNGAMNVAGSYFVGGNQVRLYPVSSPSSCVYIRDNSEMVMGDIPDEILREDPTLNGGNLWRGHFVTGTLRDNNFNGSSTIYQHSDAIGTPPPANRISPLNNGTDSVDGVGSPNDIALDPVLLLTQGENRSRDNTDNIAIQDGNWEGRWWVDEARLYNFYQPTPFVDDTYRADDRWGPKPLYSEKPLVALPEVGLDNIADSAQNEIDQAGLSQEEEDRLTRLAPPGANATDEESYGLDGYWERRAIAQGVRVIVGQRLELGNNNGWATEVDADNDGFDQSDDLNNNGLWDFDPLYPPPVNAANPQDPDFGDVDRPAPNALTPPQVGAIDTNGNSSMDGRQHEMRQWRTLRNNAAAAQSTTLYHYLMDQGQYPVACIASAAHPGTRQTIEASTTFNPISPADNRPNVSFLTGEGSNGWEFYPFGHGTVGAVTSASLAAARVDFAAAINDDNGDLRDALHNLAYFAGDPAGAFPPYQDGPGDIAANSNSFFNADQQSNAGGPVVHPFPIQSMWGDFSNLRRVVDKLEGNAFYGNVFGNAGAVYDQLSIADQTTLQTASCTLGILAYNVNNILDSPDVNESFLSERKLLNAIRNLQTDNVISSVTSGGDDFIELNYLGNNDPEYSQLVDEADQLFDFSNPAASIPSDVFVDALAGNGDLTADEMVVLRATLDRLQVQRDRSLGFSQGLLYTAEFGNSKVLGQDIAQGQEIRLQCDFIANDYFGFGEPTNPSTENEFLTVALTLCPNTPKYPSLAYIFPDRDHAHDGQLESTNDLDLDGIQEAARQQPATEPYTSDDLLVNGSAFNNAYTFTREAGGSGSSWNGAAPNRVYRVVGDGNNNGILDDGEDDLDNIALAPKVAYGDWSQPNTGDEVSANGDDEDRINRIVGPDGAERWLAFLDKGILNGRDAMLARVMDIDLDLLRRNLVAGGNNQLGGNSNVDWWLPLPQILNPAQAPTRTGAAIYAFREDTVREDGIARPRANNPDQNAWETAWLAYVNNTPNNTADPYLMDAVSDNFKDPPVNPSNGISPKPVDFYPDPDRRIHGFRLRNGIDLRRVGATAAVPDPDVDLRGMSFVSDNPVYVQGDFNLHSTSGRRNDIIQEFEQTLDAGWDADDFYGRTELDDDFARVGDSWRATEIIGDGVSLLSRNYSGRENNLQYLDGWIAQGIIGGNGNFGDRSPFRQLNEPSNDFRWVREDGTVRADNDVNHEVPIKISQRGFPVYCSVSNTTLDDEAPTGTGANQIPDGFDCAAMGFEEREYGLRDNALGFRSFDDARQELEDAPNDNYMNMLMVSGTLPSRANQSNGGLHNFPRFLERFGGQRRMWLAGSIYQLSFSTTATGPFDQDSWEPGAQPQAGFGPGEDISYYSPPNRLWGYDTALQLVQPAPIAQRFASPSNIRSEFYRELSVDDPYIVNLRCALNDPTAIDAGLCPPPN